MPGLPTTSTNNPSRRAWLRFTAAQPLVWIVLGLASYAIEAHQVEAAERWMATLRALTWAGSGAGLSVLLGLLCHRLQPEQWRRSWTATAALATGLAGSFVWFALAHEANGLLGADPDHQHLHQLTMTAVFHGTLHRVVMLLLWLAAGLVMAQSELTARARDRALELQQVLLEARIGRLRGQLNPHFLFNSLNAAMALVDEDREAAKTVLLRLSQLLRDTLSASDRDDCSVERELALARRYLDIEQLRFEDNLEVRWDVDGAASRLRIPPFLLLPLVENAIKHGMLTATTMPLHVTVSAGLHGDQLVLGVCNDGQLTAAADAGPPPGERKGLETLRQRLEMEMDGQGTFTLRQDGPQVVARLRLPGPPVAPEETTP